MILFVMRNDDGPEVERWTAPQEVEGLAVRRERRMRIKVGSRDNTAYGGSESAHERVQKAQMISSVRRIS
jgi:hypothetical protein